MPDTQLFLIDAHALCYRAYFAIRGLSTSKGQATNAIFGFLRTLKKILKEFHPQYLAVCFDVGAKTYRQEKFSQYKIQRRPMPEDLISQLSYIKEIVLAYNIPIFEKEGFEADDCIATIAQKIPKADLEVVIVSEDKDMLQLINEKIKVYSVRNDRMLSHKDIKDFIGIGPQLIPDYIGLAGDNSDNIPGVKGIGEVSAKNLINQFGPIENIFKNVNQLKPIALKERLLSQKDMAFFSKDLAILRGDVPLEVDLKELQVKKPNYHRLFEIFNELEFKRDLEELSPYLEEQTQVKNIDIETSSQLKDLVSRIMKIGQCSFLFDFSYENLSGQDHHILISIDGKEVFQANGGHWEDLKPVFENNHIVKITYDLKEKIKILKNFSMEIKGEVFDCLLAGYLLQPSRGSYDIKTLAGTYLKIPSLDKDKHKTDTVVIYQLYPVLKQELQEKELFKLFTEVEIPLAHVLAHMEMQGVKIDEPLLKKLSKECQEKMSDLENQLYVLAKERFNLNSPKQLSQVLFEKLKLPVIKKIKTGFSTDEEVLNKLALQHRLPALILEYRQIAKLKSTYIDALPQLVNKESQKIHACFNQTGTETGRLSSSNPNLQNIPIRTELGRKIRKAFIPSQKGNRIICADYSQVELRILAHLAKDQNLKEAFCHDLDIHQKTAALIYDVKEHEVTPSMRNSAKRVNFGIIYGMSAYGLAKDLEIPQPQAQEFIDKFFLCYPKVKDFMEETIRKCEEKGYVVTLFNRRRYLPEINSPQQTTRQFAQRQAINTPIQGSAADLLKLVMIRIQKELEAKKLLTKMNISVHDELVFDAPQDEEKIMIEMIREHMEKTISLSIPIKVAIKIGDNWLQTQEVE